MTTKAMTRATVFELAAPLTEVRAGDVVKRVFDVGVALFALVALAPLLALVALCIFAADFGSPFFVQTRVGKNGREFKFFKFRSMVRNADAMKALLIVENGHGDPRRFKMRTDPRVTRIGAIVRRTSVDELPQIWNVLVGDMSIVGPRPALPCELVHYTAWDRRRLAVMPGLTCIWQVSGRSELPFPTQVELDLEYIRTRCLLVDLALIVRTVPAVMSGRGAY